MKHPGATWLLFLLHLGLVAFTPAALEGAINTPWTKAFAALQSGQPAAALTLLAEQEAALGRPTPRVESLKVYAHVALKDWKNARIALTRYQQLAGSGASSEAHKALLKLEPEIDRGLAEADAQWRKDRERAEAALLKSLAAAEAADRKAREAALRRESVTVTRLEAKERSRQSDETIPPALAPDEITEAQIASLVAEPAELAGWLEVHAHEAEAAPLARRLQQHLATTPLTAPLATGSRVLVGLARETDMRVFSSFPVEELAALAGQPVALDLYHAVDRWVLRAMPWSLPAGARAHLLIARTEPATARAANLAAGYLPTGHTQGDGLACDTFITLPVRQTRDDPGQNPPEADAPNWQRSPRFDAADLSGLIAQGQRLVNLSWADGQWHAILLRASPASTAPSVAIQRNAPMVGFVAADDASGLMRKIQERPASAPQVVKLVAGPDQWVALTDEQSGPAIEWLLVDSLDDPVLALLLEAGRKIHLLAGLPASSP